MIIDYWHKTTFKYSSLVYLCIICWYFWQYHKRRSDYEQSTISSNNSLLTIFIIYYTQNKYFQLLSPSSSIENRVWFTAIWLAERTLDFLILFRTHYLFILASLKCLLIVKLRINSIKLVFFFWTLITKKLFNCTFLTVFLHI